MSPARSISWRWLSAVCSAVDTRRISSEKFPQGNVYNGEIANKNIGTPMQVPLPAPGVRLMIKRKKVPFGLWPTREIDSGNFSLQPLLFALDPWAMIKRAIEEKCPLACQPEAFAYIAQAEDFYAVAVEKSRIAARPLSVYYCFMNLVKAFCLTRRTRPNFDKAQHGLSEQLGPGGRELTDAFLDAYPSPNSKHQLQNFSEFLNALTGNHLPSATRFEMPKLLPQILPGHRLWAHAVNKKERFLAFHDIQFWANSAAHEMWVRLYVVAEDLSRIGVTNREFLAQSGLGVDFAQVKVSDLTSDGRKVICFEQVLKKKYNTSKPGNELTKLLVNPLRHKLWTTVASVPPYRRFYAYICPPSEVAAVLPQLAAVYAASYYLGSITRYRPHHFDKLVKSAFGPRIQDFVTGQPQQFLYLMASEFAQQDIAKPSII